MQYNQNRQAQASYVTMPICCCNSKVSIKSAFNFIMLFDTLLVVLEILANLVLLNTGTQLLTKMLYILCIAFLAISILHFVLIVGLCS
jgi:hypothetical protein